jgi:hypothetical protein
MDITGSLHPGSQELPRDAMHSYQPVTRAGEVINNAFVNTSLWNTLEAANERDTTKSIGGGNTKYARPGDPVPTFPEWATVHPGEICVQQRYDNQHHRFSIAAETASPVIACAQCMPEVANNEFFFAGIARSKSVRPYDDGRGPKVDEYFTLTIGGLATILNNGKDAIMPGEVVEWTFDDPYYNTNGINKGPRRIIVRSITSQWGTHSNVRAFGIAKTQANRNERFDVLLGPHIM